MYNVQVLLNLNKWKKKKQVQLVIKILALLMISGSTVCVIVNHLYYTGYVVPVLGVAIMYFLMTALQSIICIVFLSKPLNDNMLEKIYKNSTCIDFPENVRAAAYCMLYKDCKAYSAFGGGYKYLVFTKDTGNRMIENNSPRVFKYNEIEVESKEDERVIVGDKAVEIYYVKGEKKCR